MNKTSADLILDLIIKNGPLSSAEIASRLRLTKSDIRYHLGKLARVGLISAAGKMTPMERGRPATRYIAQSPYRPTDDNSLFQALLELLSAYLVEADQSHLDGLIQKVFGFTQDHQLSRTQQIIRTVQVFERKGYDAKWEARPQAPIVLFHRCPYINLVLKHPEICEFDRKALEYSLGCPVKLIHTRYDRIELPCQFSIMV